MPNPGDIVEVQNKGERAVTIAWDSKSYVLNPDEPRHVPFEAVMLWFGDPRSSGAIVSVKDERGVVGFVPDRESEVRRLRLKWGLGMTGDETGFEDVDGNFVPPIVEVYDLNGDRVTTVLEDPSGDSVMPAQPTVSQQDKLEQVILRQQQQIDELRTQMGLGQAPSGVPLEEVPPEFTPGSGSLPEDEAPTTL